MSDFTPTSEQVAIIAAATETKDNLLVTALAGAAKTTTLVLLAKALPKVSILCLAFNKRIADEMKERLPQNCEAKTLNGLGHRAWGDYLGRRLILDDKKVFRLLSSALEDYKGEERTYLFDNFADIKRAIEFGKTNGWVPDGHFPQAKRLVNDDEFFAHMDEDPDELVREVLRLVTIESMKEALAGTIDFNDQLLMPTIYPATFPFYPLVLIDEAQDLSALNHAMLAKIAKKRLIAVGDECQSIYGFRGAHQDSMNLLFRQFNMKQFPLTISFRCPTNVVNEARWRAPAMQFPDWAKPGHVETLGDWSVEDIPAFEDVAIICRNNAPLFQMAIRMLRDGRYSELVGNDLGKSLIKQLKKLGKPDTPREEVLALINEWEAKKLEKTRNEDRVRDTAACLRVFASEGKTLQAAVDYAERIMAVAGPTKLMTGHKSKGLEFEVVFILDRDLIKKGEAQDRNLLYVMQTRAKDRLYYVKSENFESIREREAQAND